MKAGLRESIVVAVIFVALTTAAALILEVLAAVIASKPVDSAAVGALAGILVTCVPVLGALYKLDNSPPQPPAAPSDDTPEIDATLERESREAIKRYLDQMIGGSKWRPGST